MATPVFLPEISHGQRSLVAYSPQSLKESDRTEPTMREHAQLSLSGVWGRIL